jgi:hypothetical protein
MTITEREVKLSSLKGEMSAYLQEVIKDRGDKELQSTRDQISRCFAKVDCFLLPHPGSRVVRKNYSGALAEMDPFFRVMVCAYVRQVLSGRALQPKVGTYCTFFTRLLCCCSIV